MASPPYSQGLSSVVFRSSPQRIPPLLGPEGYRLSSALDLPWLFYLHACAWQRLEERGCGVQHLAVTSPLNFLPRAVLYPRGQPPHSAPGPQPQSTEAPDLEMEIPFPPGLAEGCLAVCQGAGAKMLRKASGWPSYCLYLCLSVERLEAPQQQNTSETIESRQGLDHRNPGSRRLKSFHLGLWRHL